MTICTYSSRTPASEVANEDLLTQATTIVQRKYGVIELTDMRRCQKLSVVYDTVDSKEVGGVGFRQHKPARAADNQELTSVLAMLCREAIKENPKREEQKCWSNLQRQDRAFATPAGTSPIVK
ncbi:hypothetical protein RB195_016075 [Necator americanus]|uniref:Uncharacterized protein n=1 Tax=Necator americanus TaxID=51031 RepID=A0ABR1E7G2_NECAM